MDPPPTQSELLRSVACCHCCFEDTCLTPFCHKAKCSPMPGEFFCHSCLNNQCPKVRLYAAEESSEEEAEDDAHIEWVQQLKENAEKEEEENLYK